MSFVKKQALLWVPYWPSLHLQSYQGKLVYVRPLDSIWLTSISTEFVLNFCDCPVYMYYYFCVCFSVNLMTCISSLTNIAKQRSNYTTTVLQTFELLHGEAAAPSLSFSFSLLSLSFPLYYQLSPPPQQPIFLLILLLHKYPVLGSSLRWVLSGCCVYNLWSLLSFFSRPKSWVC